MFKQIKFILGLIITSILIMLAIRLIFNFDGLYGQDSYEYLRYTKALNNYFQTGSNPGDYFWPLYYPIFGSLLSFFIEPDIALQFISILSTIITALYISKIIALLNENKKNIPIYVLIFFCLSPMVLRLSVTSMSDSLSTVFVVLFFYKGFIYTKKNQINSLYLSLIFGLCAIMTRYGAFVVMLPHIIYIIYIFFKRKENLNHILGLFFIAFLLISPHFIIRQENTTEFLQHDWLLNWSITNFYQNSFTTVDGISNNLFPNILYAFSSIFHPRYLFLGLFFIPFILKSTKNSIEFKILILSFISYGLFLAGIPFQNNRFLLLSFPLFIIILFTSFNSVFEKFYNHRSKQIIIVIVTSIQLALCYYSLTPMLERNYLERDITSKLKSHQNRRLYSFDIDIALQGRGLVFEYKNLWKEEYKVFPDKTLVLFHPTKFKKQWKGKKPIINWDNLITNYNLKVIQNLPEGWVLYEVISKK